MVQESSQVRLEEGLGKVSHCREKKRRPGKMGLVVFAGKTRMLERLRDPSQSQGADQAV